MVASSLYHIPTMSRENSFEQHQRSEVLGSGARHRGRLNSESCSAVWYTLKSIRGGPYVHNVHKRIILRLIELRDIFRISISNMVS